MSELRHRFRRGWVVLRTIRVRLTLWYVVLLAAILVVFAMFLYLNLARSLHAELDRSLEVEAQQINAMVGLDKGRPEFKGRADRLEPGMLVVLQDLAGRRVFANDDDQHLPNLAEALSRASQGDQTLSTVQLADGTAWRLLTRPLVVKERLVGTLQVARTQEPIEATLRQLLVLLAGGLPVTLVLAIGGGLFLAGRALDPIDRITRTAEQIGAEDLSRRLNLPASPDEVGRLAATFDHMLERIERAYQRQRQFTADAAHELRTPLALLRTQIEVALAGRGTPDEHRAVLSGVHEDAVRMTQLVNDLLTLARADAGQEALVFEPLHLNALADDLVGAMAPLAESRGVRLERGTAEPEVHVEADQMRLTQLLVNLVDNGLKYTPAGGTVTVAVGQTPAGALLRVADTGVGIAPEHLPHLFERFYRVDKARARAEGGAGLGLAISQWLARAHGGEITVESRPGRGTTFIVRVPRPCANQTGTRSASVVTRGEERVQVVNRC